MLRSHLPTLRSDRVAARARSNRGRLPPNDRAGSGHRCRGLADPGERERRAPRRGWSAGPHSARSLDSAVVRAQAGKAVTRIVRAELFELALPLVEPFVISGGTIAERRSLIVILHDAAGHVGYGESA